MHWLDFPPPRKNRQLAFSNQENARAWLAVQPQADPVQMQSILLDQIEALDGGSLTPAETLPLLNFLKSAATGVQTSLEPHYLRKPLPMASADQKIFETARQLWTQLGIAYLRIAPHFAPADRLLPLHQAAVSIRLAEYCHLQAAQESPALIGRLLFAILEQAERANLQRLPVIDQDYRHLGESNIAGHVAWAFLLRLVEPYRLSSHQLAVANRAISRWRELANFQALPDSDPKAQAIMLDKLFGGPIPEGLPRYLDVRPIIRKLRNRIEALQAGESPESLKLGRELSSAACIQLLHELQTHLSQRSSTPTTEVGEVALAFGCENAYALFSGKPLHTQGLGTKSASISHQRVAMFGFDRLSQLPNAVHKLDVPSETWTLVDGLAVRPVKAGERHLTPCLVASTNDKGPRLGVLLGLRAASDDALRAQLGWYPEQVSAGFIKRAGGPLASIPVFTLTRGGKTYLIAPTNAGIKLDVGLNLEEASPAHLTPIEVSERGTDFVRFLCTVT
jgi:hypothetical protein